MANESRIAVSYDHDVDKSGYEFFNFKMDLTNVRRETLLYVLNEMSTAIEKLPKLEANFKETE